jgi:hypothetical protein
MTTKSIKLIVFIALLVHGIGHFQGVVAAFGVKINNKETTKSWLLKNSNKQTLRILMGLLFLSTAVLGILTALSFNDILLNQNLWQTLAIPTAILSTLCLIIFPNALAMFFNKVGAVAVNLFIYYSVMFNGNWPSVIFED